MARDVFPLLCMVQMLYYHLTILNSVTNICIYPKVEKNLIYGILQTLFCCLSHIFSTILFYFTYLRDCELVAWYGVTTFTLRSDLFHIFPLSINRTSATECIQIKGRLSIWCTQWQSVLAFLFICFVKSGLPGLQLNV